MSKVYACSDLHGYYNLYEKILKIIKPEDKLICLGDCNDRGPDSYKLIVAMLGNPQVIYLKGNHEDMLVKALQEYYDEHLNINYTNLLSNGGEKTFYDCIENDIRGKGIIRALQKLKTQYIYENRFGKQIICSHAGFTPDFRKEIDLLWDRIHLIDNWNTSIYFENTYIVHGHTPIQILRKKYGFFHKELKNKDMFSEITEAQFYCSGHKIDIDAGAYDSGKAILFDLDTFNSIIVQ